MLNYKEQRVFCPNCGESCLHQSEASLIWGHDNDKKIIYKNSRKLNSVETAGPKVPGTFSSRDQINIKFWCESCSYETELYLYQHKGETFIGFDSKKSKELNTKEVWNVCL